MRRRRRRTSKGIAKQRDSRYEQRRSSQWLKIKTQMRQEVVIGGYTAPRKTRAYFGALVVGVYRDGALQYVGHVGGGFNRQSLQQTFEAMQPLKTDQSPFADPPHTNEEVQWLRPQLVAEVKFAEWTADDRMRQPILLGLRDDKDPKEVTRERRRDVETEVSRRTTRTDSEEAGAVIALADFLEMKAPGGDVQVRAQKHVAPLTHLDKVFWPDEGYTKGDLLQYYAAMGETLMPHLKDRALILIRYPNGIKGKFFFQHEVKNAPEFVRTEALAAEAGRVIDYAIADNLATLLYVVNLGAIAPHSWNSRVSKLDYPDWIVFDLDPEKVAFDAVCEVALAVKDVLDELELEGYPKTSGASGMHVYVPIKPIYRYEQVADFAERVAALVAARNPDCATLERSLKKRRSGKVYVDHLQNAKGKTVASVYAVRATPGATVSAPLDWVEVASARKPSLQDFTLADMVKRVAKKGDLFKPVLTNG